MKKTTDLCALKLLPIAFWLALSIMSCGSQTHYIKRDIITEENDRQSIVKPKEQEVSLFEDAIDNVFTREIDEYADLSLHSRRIANNLKQAKNTNALDEVPNSSWFTNRHQMNAMSIAELKRGPNQKPGPDMSGTVTITKAKVEGVSPGFRMKDSRGDTYFVKFDIKGFSQLNTAAEVVTTKFVYACGYNTPENYLTTVNPQQIRIGEGVTVKNKWGKKLPMTQEFVDLIFSRVESNQDGSYRIVASKGLEGAPLGPFYYADRRKDDPNDRVSHQHRRELRGYKVIAAWLNNSDSKASNTLDMYVMENGKSFVRHYIIDFATSIGSGGFGKAATSRGHRGAFDLANTFKRISTIGLYVEPYEKKSGLISPAVGYFDSDLFNPGHFASIVPNPAFQRMTDLDGFWAAKIVMSFSDEQIRAIVETGEYQNQQDIDYITKTLAERRDKTGRYWYGKVNPLDKFEFTRGHDNQIALKFNDLSVDAGFVNSKTTAYRYLLQYRGKNLTTWFSSDSKALLPLNEQMLRAIETEFNALQNIIDDDRILNLKIETRWKISGSWGKNVKVFFYYPPDASNLPQIMAIERED